MSLRGYELEQADTSALTSSHAAIQALPTASRTITTEHHRGCTCAMVQPQWRVLYRQFAHPPSPTRMGVLRNAFARGRREICVARALLCRFWASWFAHRHGCCANTAHNSHLLQRLLFMTAIRKRAPFDGDHGQFLWCQWWLWGDGKSCIFFNNEWAGLNTGWRNNSHE